ncbi:hypothetical protein H5410_017270 [Solanum commersonii]|uniref:Uncharacterized protein n=1 Tax=Solanum commersonii TaxID=4109 RepID=A0A9J5ZYM0_SOLCO|nr:hypothetical protein H5410_017270 [Solanum commersonii]
MEMMKKLKMIKKMRRKVKKKVRKEKKMKVMKKMILKVKMPIDDPTNLTGDFFVKSATDAKFDAFR